MLGGLLGDHVRGLQVLRRFPPAVRRGIRLHRHIDRFTDHHPQVKALLRQFPKPFRRYGGIIIDVAFDHELAKHWGRYAEVPLDDFDAEIRALLARNDDLVPDRLRSFMRYADRRGLFAAYRHESEMLYSLAGVGTRLRRANPLGEVDLVWHELAGPCAVTFEAVFPLIQSEVDDWVKRTSTITGS